MTDSDHLQFPSFPQVHAAVADVLREDLGDAGDVTTNAIFSEADTAIASIMAKELGIVSGGPMVMMVYGLLDERIEITQYASEGSRVEPGERVFRIEGPARGILAGERTALNFLQRMSGIATLTHRYVAAAGPHLTICDTRKTNPRWRLLDRYAVRCGGGRNHRFGLFDMVMIKDTHSDACGGLAVALQRVAHLRPGIPIAAEARNLEEVRAALDARVDLLMLDNMKDAMIAEALTIINGAVPVEVTGNITPERLPVLAAMGVPRASAGALTHSARAMDYSMKTKVTAGG